MKNESLSFVTEYLKSNQIPVRIFKPPCESLSWLDMGLRESILHSEENMADTLNAWLNALEDKKVYRVMDDFQCNYVVLRIPESDEIMICGPVLFEEIREERRKEIMKKTGVPEALEDRIGDYFYRIPYVSGQTMYQTLFSTLADQLYGKDQYDVLYTDFSAWRGQCRNYDDYYRIPDKPFLSIQLIEDRYEVENAILGAVGSGNVRQALESCGRWSLYIMPQRLTNELRDRKDYMITLNTLLRKTVEQAGVHPIHIDAVSNSNIQHIEQLSGVDQIQGFMARMVGTYCDLVRKHNLKNYSLLTQKIITYVDTELCADLSLKSLSERLSVNASYLSTLFKKEVGLPLTEFVNRRRITYAQSLLIHTALPIKTVAQKCGIPDVYYFSRLFKRITGTTPKAYRSNTSAYDQYQEQFVASQEENSGTSRSDAGEKPMSVEALPAES